LETRFSRPENFSFTGQKLKLRVANSILEFVSKNFLMLTGSVALQLRGINTAECAYPKKKLFHQK